MKTKSQHLKSLYFLIAFVCVFNSASSQEITMFPGWWKLKYYQDDAELSGRQVELLMRKDAVTNRYWQKAKTHATVGYVAFGVELGTLLWWASTPSAWDNNAPLAISLVTAVAGTGFLFSSSNLRKKAILRYNNNLQDEVSLEIAPTINGVELLVKF